MAVIFSKGHKSLTLGDFRKWSENMSDDTILTLEASPKYGSIIFAKVTRAEKVGKTISLWGEEK